MLNYFIGSFSEWTNRKYGDDFWERNAIARKKLEEHVGFIVKG